ncbi:mitogen-activated protein kinase 15 isoform X2 [Sorex araneus]|uniref:mitogen-activated protein kinase 15 isoform X2 n=1 Tax=Sorex araneus TaxID=42254 RepID=UPI002433C0A9|nr:mitogen-activated protein kinase 15 isoform X2 [Sorex araneus]
MCTAEVDGHVVQRYLLRRRLGKGAYGIVWKAVDRRTREVVAIKKIFDAFRDEMDAQRTFREVALLQEFQGHPNIIRLLDVIPAANDKDLYLVFESMDTDLHAAICKGTLLKDIHKRYIFAQLLRATKFIHSGGVIHRDQKPANVLLDANCVVKLCDFGMARPLSAFPQGPEGQALTEYVATRWYRAPEVLLSSCWYTPGVDLWSLGCILGEMLRGCPLFPGTSTFHQLQLILDTVPPPCQEDLQALGSSFSAAIRHRLDCRPPRPLDTLLPSDTPPEALDLLGKLLVFTPDKRLSAAQALRHPYVKRFHCPASEWALDSAVRLPGQQERLSAREFRSRLYRMVVERRESGPGGAVLGADPALRPRAAPDPRRPPGSLDGAQNVPRQGGARPREGRQHPTPQAESPAPRAGPAPSLTSQAAAGVANRVLIRSDGNPDRGARMGSERRVPHTPPAGHRPGRRMFSSSDSQGAQGAARAALGGYSQAYGTVCQSALNRLALLPGPRT